MSLDWRDLVKERRYGAVRWLDLPPEDQRAFLAHLRVVVPMVVGRYLLRHAIDRASLDGKSLHEAALILAAGELEAAVAGDPLTEVAQWAKTILAIEEAVSPYAEDHGPTVMNGQPADLVSIVRETLETLQKEAAFYAAQETDKEARDFLLEAMATAAQRGFQI